MKYNKRIICFLMPFLLLCNAQAQDIVHLSGRIESPLCDSVEVTYNDNYLAYYPKHFVAKTDKKGNFKLQFPVPHGVYTQAELRHADRLAEIILQGDDTLLITVNAKHFDSTIHYSGRGAAIQNFIAKHTIEKGRMNQYTLKIKNHFSKEPAEFIKAIALEHSAETNYLDNVSATLPSHFITYWKSFYKYYNYFFMEQYPLAHEMIRLRRYTDTIPDTNYSVARYLRYDFNDTLLQVPSYLLYLTGVFETKLKAAGFRWVGRDTIKLQEQEDSVYKLAVKMLPDNSAEYFMAQNIYGRAKNQRLAKTEEEFANYKKRWPGSANLPLLEKQVGIARKLAPGQPAPDFDIHTQDGRHIKLSDLRGKVVYLDFWGTWCKQCIGEMIGSKKLKDMIRKEPVEFVYVSLDNDTATRAALVNRYKIEGTFTYLSDMWNAKEVEMYGVQGLPAYFLIDTQGNFALQSTPSPMQAIPMLLEIEKLLKKKD